jgi:hypothetical protein
MKIRSAIISLVEDGSEWLVAQSKVLVKNLNAEYLGGKRFDQYCRKRAFTIGDGESSSFLLDHGLGCELFGYSFINQQGKQIQVEHSLDVINENSVNFTFSFIPSNGQFKILIIG